jgi:3-oxoacyl-[acyl-carrier-protein] synthase II
LEKKVVVTGLGMVAPTGNTVESAWKNICDGRSGVSRITRFDAGELQTQIAGEVKGFVPEDYVDKKDIKRMDLFIQYSMAAAEMAVRDAGLTIDEGNGNRVGVIVGTGLGGLPTIEKYHKVLMERGPGRITPFFIPMLIANLAAGHIAIRFGAKGPNTCIVTACATGAHCIGDSMRAIKYGDADVIITGGTEANLTPLCVAGFNVMKAISVRNDDPEGASRPFDRDRDGFVVAEGAGIIILESLEYAKKRGAPKIYAELAGYGYNGDAYHITAPAPQGEGAARCMEMALADARITPDEVDHINAHGTSTILNDITETQAVKRVFGDRAGKIPISATKSMTGHLLGAAGSVEAIFSILSIQDGIMPPTINLENADPECDLDYVPHKAREGKVDVVVSNAFGFGGPNAVLVFRRFND